MLTSERLFFIWSKLAHQNQQPSLVKDELAYLGTDMWTAYYLHRDGHVSEENYLGSPDTLSRSNSRTSISALVLAAKNYEMPELLELLPEPPSNQLKCPSCYGERFLIYQGNERLCYICAGAGWTTQEILDACIAQGYTKEYWGTHPLDLTSKP